ncbi:Periplasmic alpha-amylase [Arenibacter antarcticus]|uniref:Alpha-amylase n=1 Tax=Arenibacter antarcticus TaxID=2040469 RepID=A0ABW5VNG7_9FLAO|nr:alpha-amylase family glycosyl hydrolase [Arenibacter sp. H213]MCM4169181.1 alpha-amlyase [Arenibacter sp. H213]
MKKTLVFIIYLLLFYACKKYRKEPIKESKSPITTMPSTPSTKPFAWEGANIYFLLTDRFYNGNTSNDTTLNRNKETGVLRGFMGGDLQGITKKIEEGYFSNLGVNAIWFTPVVEQIHDLVNEGTGNTYGYHGYWTKDWTALDPNFGTKKELETLVKTAHIKGIRILMDVVLNHTGPVTDIDPVWPSEWVRTGPVCEYTTYESTTACTLVKNLPDIKTESDAEVELPDALMAKWKKEGRLSQELDELQLFFDRTGHPRVPKYYIIKWLTDYVNDLGIDGFRVDTAKHVDENTWTDLQREASYVFNIWKKKHPEKVLDDNPFFMVGEVYGYGISNGRQYDFGDRKVDYFAHGFTSLINFELKYDAKSDYETIFKKYNDLLKNSLKGKSVVNYLASHDDGQPYDKDRKLPYRAANVLLLTPGASQIYYGDETNRSLSIPDAQGDATLRSFMNWEQLDSLAETKKILAHWQKLGQFRNNHPAVGAGTHNLVSKLPYVFSRSYEKGNYKDKVVIGLNLPKGKKDLKIQGFFDDGTKLFDTYSQTHVTVTNGTAFLDNDFDIALLELAQ